MLIDLWTIVLWTIGGILTYSLSLAQFYSTCPEKLWGEGAWKGAVGTSIFMGLFGYWGLAITLIYMLFAHLLNGDRVYKYQGFRWWK